MATFRAGMSSEEFWKSKAESSVATLNSERKIHNLGIDTRLDYTSLFVPNPFKIQLPTGYVEGIDRHSESTLALIIVSTQRLERTTESVASKYITGILLKHTNFL